MTDSCYTPPPLLRSMIDSCYTPPPLLSTGIVSDSELFSTALANLELDTVPLFNALVN